MNNQIAIARKLAQITELVAEVAALMECPKPKTPASRKEFLVDVESIAEKYPSDEAPTRWMTCAQVCVELGIKPTRGYCSSVGFALKRLGFATRRSNGRNLVHVPLMIDVF